MFEGLLAPRFPLPLGERPSALRWGGQDNAILYAFCTDGKAFQRKLNAKGVNPGDPPSRPAGPRL